MGVIANKMVFDLISKVTEKIRKKLNDEKKEYVSVKIYTDYPVESRTVREEVFMAEQGFSYDYDKLDDTATHFVLFYKDMAVGACRVFKSEKDDTYLMGRLAVKKEYRGKDFGSMLVDAAKEYVKAVGGDSIILHSQLQAKGFYEKNGFCEFGEIEYEENCPHIWMKVTV